MSLFGGLATIYGSEPSIIKMSFRLDMHPKSRPWIWFYPLVVPPVKLHLRRIHGPTFPPLGSSPSYTQSSTVNHQYLGVGDEYQLRKVYTCAHLSKLVARYIER